MLTLFHAHSLPGMDIRQWTVLIIYYVALLASVSINSQKIISQSSTLLNDNGRRERLNPEGVQSHHPGVER